MSYRGHCIGVGALLATFILSACGARERVATGPTREDPLKIERGDAQRANIELNMGAGELNVGGAGSDLVDGMFVYNVDDLKPLVQQSASGSHSVITIRQPSHQGVNIGNVKNAWNLNLNEQVLWDITVNCGAGKAQLGFGPLQLRSLDVHIGVGQVDVNLEGTPKRDYEVNISGGVGQATVHLPKNVGIRAEAHGGLGSIDVTGLEKTGDHYENDLYDKTKVNVRLKVDGGVGEIRLIG